MSRLRIAPFEPTRLSSALLLIPLIACSTARPLKPLPPGEWAVEASQPAIFVENNGVEFPIASLVFGARVGVTEEVEARFRIHPVPLALGIVSVEGGAVWHVQPAAGWMPGFHLTTDLSITTAPGEWGEGAADSLRAAGDVAVIAHWEPHPMVWPYVVADNAVIFVDGTVVTSAMAGVQFFPGHSVELSVEFGYAGFQQPTRDFTQPFVGIDGRGALYMAFGLAYRTDARKAKR